jgi:hypothetical protein
MGRLLKLIAGWFGPRRADFTKMLLNDLGLSR